MALGRAVSLEEMAAAMAEVEALVPQICGLLLQYSPNAGMASLANVAACVLMTAEPSVAESNAAIFFNAIADQMVKIRLVQANLGGLPN